MEYLKKGIKVGIREMTAEDCADIVRWRNTEKVRSHYVYREEFTLETEKKYFEDQVLTGKVFQYIICELDRDGRAIGSAVFKDYRPEERQIEYGLFIGEEDTDGKGLGKEASQLCIAMAFEKFDVDRVLGRIFHDNIASLVSHIRIGMFPCGYIKDVQCTDGEVKDMVLVAAEKERFTALMKAAERTDKDR